MSVTASLMESSIDIHAEDWLMTAGLIGLSRLFEDELETTPTGVRLYTSQLPELAQRYFNYFIETYDIAKRDADRMEQLLNQAKKKPDQCKARMTDIKKLMSDQVKKVEKYFADTAECHQLIGIIEQTKSLKEQAHLAELENLLPDYHRLMKTSFINEKLTLNYAKAVIIAPFFGQPSFLQASCNVLNKAEHEAKLHSDYVHPAILEIQFQGILSQAQSMEEIQAFLKEHDTYAPFKAWYREVKKMTELAEIQAYFAEQVYPCTIVEGLFGTLSYEEMIFSPLGISHKKAFNFYWDFDRHTPIPISALAKLILFLIPVGLTFYNRKLGNGNSGENIRFAGLVIQNRSFLENIKTNENYRRQRQTGSNFGDMVIGLLSDTQSKAEKKESAYLFVEVFSDYQVKKTLLDYYHMPEHVAKFFRGYGNVLKWIGIREYRENYVRSILQGNDPKQVIFNYLREAVTSPQHGFGAYMAVRERYRLKLLEQGVSDVKNQDKRVYVVYQQGLKIKKAIDEKANKASKASDSYRASGNKKVEGIAYRLLNAARAGDRQQFLDTVFRLHISSDEKVSSIFLDALKDEEGLDFATVSGAFIAGLLSNKDETKGQDGSEGQEQADNQEIGEDVQ